MGFKLIRMAEHRRSVSKCGHMDKIYLPEYRLNSTNKIVPPA